MSIDDRETIKRAAMQRLTKEPFLHLLLTSALGGVVYLSVNGKGEYIPWMVGVSFLAVVISAVGVVCSWIGSRLEQIVTAGEKIANAYQTLAERDKVTTQFLIALSAEVHRHRRTILLIEDNVIHQRLIREVLIETLNEHDLSFSVVSTLEDGIAQIRNARVAIIDVSLADNTMPAAINMVIELLGNSCPVIIHTGTEYGRRDFPRASAVLTKGDGINIDGLMAAIKSALRHTEEHTH